MWGTLTALLLLVSNIQAQTYTSALSYDEQIINKIADIDTTKENIGLNYNTELTVIQSTQSAVSSLAYNLPNVVVNERLSAVFTTIEAMSIALRGTNESNCFQNFGTTKATAVEQARLTFSSCTSNITSSTSSLTANINTALTSLNTLANAAKSTLQACGTNKLYRLSDVLFKYCLTTATVAYEKQLASLVTAVRELQVKRKSNVIEVATCAGRAVSRSEFVMENFTNNTTICISTSPFAAKLIALIKSIQLNNQSVYSYVSQVTDPLDTSANVSVAEAETQASFSVAAMAVTAANNAKAQTSATAKSALEAEFSNTAAAFTAAGNDFATNTFATTCVTNIRAALEKNIVTQSTNFVACLQAIRSNNLANDLAQLQNSYNQRLLKEELTAIQCIGQLDNLVVDPGITRCREDVEADDVVNLLFLSYKAMSLKEEANLVSTAADRCNAISRRYVTRQISKDKVSFETCILRKTLQVYSISSLKYFDILK